MLSPHLKAGSCDSDKGVIGFTIMSVHFSLSHCLSTYLSPGVNVHDLLGLVLPFLKGKQLLVVALQVLLLQSDHHPPAGGRAGAPQQQHVLGHGFRRLHT